MEQEDDRGLLARFRGGETDAFTIKEDLTKSLGEANVLMREAETSHQPTSGHIQ
jgi:hypothetical protein